MSEDKGAKSQRVQIFNLFRLRSFTYLIAAQVVSTFGNSITFLAAFLLINELTGSTSALATLALLMAIPNFTFGIYAGALADRLDRKVIMLSSDILSALLVLILVWVSLQSVIWPVFLLVFLQSAVTSFYTPARTALLAQLVEESEMMTAYSIARTATVIASVLGTTVAGLIVGFYGMYWIAFLLDALTFLGSFSLLILLRPPEKDPTSASDSEEAPEGVWTSIKDGFNVIRSSRVLLSTMVGAGIAMLGLGTFNILYIPLLTDILKVPEVWFGAVEAVEAAALILSGVLFTMLAARFSPKRVTVVGLIFLGLFVAAISQVKSIFGVLVLLALIAFTETPINASVGSLVQMSVTNRTRGRVAAALNAVATGGELIAMALAGFIADLVGVMNVFAYSGILTILAGFSIMVMLRNYQEPSSVKVDITNIEKSGVAVGRDN